MSSNKYIALATDYFVDDLPSALIPATRIVNILDRLKHGIPLTQIASAYLEDQGLLALHRYARNGSSLDEFRTVAKEEQLKRKQVAEALRLAKIADMKEKEYARQKQIKIAQEKAIADRIALERDPKYIAKIKNQKLRAKYDVNIFIKQPLFNILMDILRRVDAGKRLNEKDILWLSTVGEHFYSEKLKSSYHSNEAQHYANEFIKNQDPWLAINASSHYRKSNKATIADKLLSPINIEKWKSSKKIKSAFFTTQGGVKRDIGCKDEAIILGKKAHDLMDNDFRPCTLIGAVYMETNCFDLGQEWYSKAVARGASERVIDSDLRSIFVRSNKANQNKMRAFLLETDPVRYDWVTRLNCGRS